MRLDFSYLGSDLQILKQVQDNNANVCWSDSRDTSDLNIAVLYRFPQILKQVLDDHANACSSAVENFISTSNSFSPLGKCPQDNEASISNSSSS